MTAARDHESPFGPIRGSDARPIHSRPTPHPRRTFSRNSIRDLSHPTAQSVPSCFIVQRWRISVLSHWWLPSWEKARECEIAICDTGNGSIKCALRVRL
jgi:hypothetical protein